MGEMKNLDVYAKQLLNCVDELGRVRVFDDSGMEERLAVAELCEEVKPLLDCEYLKFSRQMKLWVKNAKVLCSLLTDEEMIKTGLPAVTIMAYISMFIGHIEELLDLLIKHYGIGNN